ncbi:MAG: TRAP transporter substrate-binding protein [Deltaproteobacteria bacterium]|nr:TRAP transporter substrate-binding protein [Deltaproteobacteria bacterium]
MRKGRKGFKSVCIAGLFVALCMAWGFTVSSHAEAAPIKLVIATWEPPKATNAQPLRDWLKELGEKSGGRVTGKISYAAMGPPPKYYDLAVKGIAHVTLVGLPYTPGRFPMSEVVNLPITGEMSSEIFAKAFWELYKKGYFDKEFKDVKICSLAGSSPYDLHMSKGQDVLRFSDIKGKKLRASGAIHTRIVKALGGTPLGMPAPEIPIALQKGTIDGAFLGWSFFKAFRTQNVVASVTEIGASSIYFATVMNRKIYNKMPDDIKAIIDELGPKYTAIAGRAFDKDMQDGRDLLKGAGGKVYKLPDADMAEVGKALAPLWKEWIAEKEAKGLPGKQIVADYYNILRGMGMQKPFHGYTP